MISKKDVQHVARLARLGLSEKEKKKIQRKLSSILDYIEKLKEVDISNIEPTSHSIKVENVIRRDEIKEEELERGKKLVEMAPDKKEGYIKVKSIL
ncbi:MAG: Asp-tRNA(Asn)/Glu-tRNA(Gln) amidotransferase subunit GatC [Candidatus Paceibacterales bacterium]